MDKKCLTLKRNKKKLPPTTYKNNAKISLESKICVRFLSGLSCGQSRAPARTVFIRDVVRKLKKQELTYSPMDEINDLDNLVKTDFDKLYSEFDEEQRKYIHPKSIKNILYYLLENPQINPKRNQKLQELGEIRIKKELLEYFGAIRNTDLDMHSASDLYDRYLTKIGRFMSEYYGFTGHGGKMKVLTLLIFLTLGIFIDTFFWIFEMLSYPIFTPMFIVLFSIRFLIKYKQKKVYGFFY